MSSLQSWISEHKLGSIGALWASAVGASMAYSGKKSPAKTSLRLIHARMHAQALTLAVLSGAALMHYYEGKHRAVDGDGTASRSKLVEQAPAACDHNCYDMLNMVI